MASSVPTTKLAASVVPVTPRLRARNHAYGTSTAYAASHSESAASSFAPASWRRETGVTSRLSSVPRSRSPLIASAPTSRVSSAPTIIPTWTTRLSASRCSRKFSASFVAAR
jgi:hypothetical protein